MLTGDFSLEELWGMLREATHEYLKEIEAVEPFKFYSSWEEPGFGIELVLSRIVADHGQGEGQKAADYVAGVSGIRFNITNWHEAA